MKKLIVLALLLTVGVSFGQNENYLKSFKETKKDYSIKNDHKIVYERVIETKYTAKENYDKLVDILTSKKTPNTFFSNILPNSDLTKLTMTAKTKAFSDSGFYTVQTILNMEIYIKDYRIKIAVYPDVYIVNQKVQSEKIINQYPFTEEDIELKKIKKKNPKITRYLQTNRKIKELLWIIDDHISDKKNLVF
jgi:hypothetical protein